MSLLENFAKAGAIGVVGIFASALLGAPSLASETPFELSESSPELEFIATEEGEVFEIAEGQEYETADDYFEENFEVSKDEYFELEEQGELISTLGVGTGTTTHGSIRINSTCNYASVDYYRSGSTSIRVRFRVGYNRTDNLKTNWSPYMNMVTRGGHTFAHATTTGLAGVRGEMQLSGSSTIYFTGWTTRC